MDALTKLKMDLLLQGYAEAEATAKEASNTVELIKKALLEAMEADQIKTHEVTDGGKVYRVTYVQAVTHNIDEEGLRKELGEELYREYCKLVLDRKMVETAMEEGQLDPRLVGKHVTERKNKPSVRFTARAADDS